ncbi:hypothetical protein HDC94_000902 [Leifsonia sp. AK011]|uniref:hypothetical protein n=1 Tax=Leifsonia sp. AK011 TaxID=2723075 RepID=UPI0015CEEC77|nr:hypothetical protein [Leifsonia sp. AK011]NYF09746.1 hypothetical protein [Leifsonia sp. AK011]
MGRALNALAIALILAGLTACTGTPIVDSTSSAEFTPTTTPTPSPTSPMRGNSIDNGKCDGPDWSECVITSPEDCHPWEFAAPDDPEAVSGWKQQIAVDGGAREFAMGEPILDQGGVPVAYIVAEGDVAHVVSERFCVNLGYLNNINGVRRHGAMMLFVGDTLNLDAHTILTVGDENGVVYDNSPPSPIPPQREGLSG